MRARRLIGLLWLGAGLAALAGPVSATPSKKGPKQQDRQAKRGADQKDEPSQRALSIGSPTDGRLVGAVALEPAQNIRLRHPKGARWGLPGLIRMIERAAERVQHRHPGGVMLVGDLSRQRGGALGGHASHESGRDADVGFYYLNDDGDPVAAPRFLRVGPDARVADQALRFDVARNWVMVESWLTDPAVIVQHIFVADPLRDLLLEHARRVRAYGPVIHRAARALKQPSRGKPHDDHFHVRIACPRGQSDVCVPVPRPPDKQGSKPAE